MLDTSIQYKVARNYCNVYGAKDLSPDPLENSQSGGVWTQISTTVHIQQETPIANRWENEILRSSDPSTQLELLDTEEGQVKELILDQVRELVLRFRFLYSIPYREALVNRILTLFKDAKEEDELSIGISPGSLRNFYYFLCAHSDLKRPQISLTPENNIYASWKAGNDKVFSVHFLPNEDTRFVVFAPNNRQPERPIRISGIATVDVLMNVVEPHGVKNWAM